MSAAREAFRAGVLECAVDPEGVHHGFVNGTHGQKIDMEVIDEAQRPDLFGLWVDLQAGMIGDRHKLWLPEVVLVGVANGANRIAKAIGDKLKIDHLETVKLSRNRVELTEDAKHQLASKPYQLAVVIDDIGTTGGTAVTAVDSVRTHNSELLVEGSYAWVRTSILTAFTEADVPYYTVIHEELPTYKPDVCAQMGFCALGWEFIPHGS